MSPLTVFLAIVVLVFGGITLALHAETRKAGGVKAWLADLPSTNARIFVSLVLSVVYVITVLLLVMLYVMNPADVRPLPDFVFDTIGLFLIGMMGLDVTQYIAKRRTHRVPGESDLPPGATGTHPVPPGATTVETQGRTKVTVEPPATGADR